MEKMLLKFLNREIIKCAKKGETCYYWKVEGLNKTLVKIVIEILEQEGKTVKSKGEDFKIIHW